MAKVTRSDVATSSTYNTLLLPDEVSETILRGAAEASLIQRYARSRPMTANTVKLTEAEITGANVFWVGEGQRKQTDSPALTKLTWTMNAAELAVIIPIDENVQEDASVDLFELYKPNIETAIAQKLDAATLFGTDFPTAWGTAQSIMETLIVAGHQFQEDGSPTDAELLDLIAGTGATPGTPTGAMEAIEEDEYEATGFLARSGFKSRIRGLKDADNRYIFGDAVQAGVPATLFGVPVDFAKSDVWVNADAHMIVGDWDQAILGTRQGVRYKVFDQGVITDGAGNVVYSLMENDMVALRVTARYGFKIIADDTADGETLASGELFPFASVSPA